MDVSAVPGRATVRVAVGVLQRAAGEALVAERPGDRHAGGGLEFPGGKCEPGEAPGEALRRELAEELGIALERAAPLIRVRHRYDDRVVELEAFRVTDWRGEPRGAEGQSVRWVAPAALAAADFPAANRPILAALTWPGRFLVTPDIDAVRDDERLLAEVAGALDAGLADGVQLRRSDRGSREWWSLLHRLAADCRRREGVRLLVNAEPEHAPALPPGAGLHLRGAAWRRLRRRPVSAEVAFSCAVHDRAGLQGAAALDADCAFLGPVRATTSHPGAPTLGWAGVAELAAGCPLPLYALGGVGPGDLDRARQAGAIGVAGIERFRPNRLRPAPGHGST